MNSLDKEEAVLQTTLAAYDALFSDLGPEARASFKETISTYSSDSNIPELDSLKSSVAYTNWNYNLVKGMGAKIAGSGLVDDDEDQIAEIASFVARDLRIVGKLTQIVEAKYEVNASNSLYQFKIAEVKQLYDADIDSINIELDSLNSRLATVESGDIGLYVYDADPVEKLTKEIATQNELLAEAKTLKSQLDSFEASTLGTKGSGAQEFTKAYADFSQLRLDVLDLKKVDLLIQLEKHSNVEGHSAPSVHIDGIRNDISINSQNTLDISTNRDKQAEFSDKTTDLKAAGLSVGGNVLYAVQAGVGFATLDDDAPVSSYIANSGYLGEAVFGGLGDILDATGNAKVASGFKGAASLALFAGNAASFAPIAHILATGKGANGESLSEQQLSTIRAEVGLQGTSLALSAIETTMEIALLAVKAGSKAASVLGTAIPIIGAIGAIVGAINPLKWAEFEQKQERIDAIRDSGTYSSGLLGDVLSESKMIEEGFYGATTAVSVVTGVGSAALAVTGVGAPLAAAVGLIGGAVSAIVGAFEQVALEAAADNYAAKIRTDENGNEQSVEDFFTGSLDQKQEQTKEHYQEFFTELVAGDDIDQVIALGGQGLDATDIELSAITKTSGELNKTAKNYIETFTDNGWKERTQELSAQTGSDSNIIQLQNANGGKTYLTFTTPLFAAGDEETSRDSTGKNAYHTTLTINDLSGWTIRDYGDNETTFNLSKVVTSVKDTHGGKFDARLSVEAGGGNDTLFSYEAGVTFKGGSGTDTASYTRLSDENLSSGLNLYVISSEDSGGDEIIVVNKNIAMGAKTYQESIETKTTQNGKRTEVVEYREINMVERETESRSTDVLYGVEILHGSSLGDSIDVAVSAHIKQVFGFGGDDVIRVGDAIEVVSGGAGNDEITLSDNVIANVFKGEHELYVDGGNGQFDAVVLSAASFEAVLGEYEAQQIREKLAFDTTEKLLPIETLNRNAEFESAYQSLVNILKNNDPEALKQVTLFNSEYIKVDLVDSGVSSDNTVHSLTEYRQALNGVFSNVDTVAKTSGEVNIFASAANNQTSVSLLGSDHNDLIEGSRYNDYLFGGEGEDVFFDSNGHDILVGGIGQDVYSYGNYRSQISGEYFGHDIITGPQGKDIRGDILTISADLYDDTFLFRYIDDLVVGLGEDRSVTIAGFYGSDVGLADANLRFTSLDREGLGSLQVTGDEFVINIEDSSVNSLSYSAFYSNDAVRTSYKSSYTAFRENGGFSALQAQPLDFSNQLSQVFEEARGGATVSNSELGELVSLSNIESTSRTTIEGTGDYNVWGDSNSNLIIGNSYSIENISAGGGDDLVIGGGGSHIIDGGDGLDIASYQNASYGIKSDLRGEQSTKGEFNGNHYSLDTLSNIEGIIATSSDDILIGNTLNNYLAGGEGVDTISGNGGNDVIHGGQGLDVLDGGAGFDIASYQNTAHGILFNLNDKQSQYHREDGNHYEEDQVSNFEGVIGTSFDDYLVGNDFDNYLAGGSGTDTIYGGAGNDTIHGGRGLDNLDGGEGFDIASYEGADFAIKFDLRGDQTEHYLNFGQYNEGDSVANFEGVIGTSMSDKFIGNDANNYFIGGAGDDEFSGGAGADQFVFKAGSGHDVITDYVSGIDRLTIDDALMANFSFEQVDQDIVIDLGMDSSITLQGANYNQFVISDYLFS